MKKIKDKGMPVLIVRKFDCLEYQSVLNKMQKFTLERTSCTRSEIWLLEHQPVFTQGQAGKDEHILNAGNIPIVKSDRGGQVTYHGPGQLVVYVMLSLKETGLGIKGLVRALENTIIKVLASYDVYGELIEGAPGVYVKKSKIAAVGLRVKNGYTYHGLSLNVNMDLSPFTQINPCGYKNLPVTQTSNLGIKQDVAFLGNQVLKTLAGEINHRLS